PPGRYPLSLHDALPICRERRNGFGDAVSMALSLRRFFARAQRSRQEICDRLSRRRRDERLLGVLAPVARAGDADEEMVQLGQERSEEHTSELQSPYELV